MREISPLVHLYKSVRTKMRLNWTFLGNSGVWNFGEVGGGDLNTTYSSPEKAVTNPFWILLLRSFQNGSKGFYLI